MAYENVHILDAHGVSAYVAGDTIDNLFFQTVKLAQGVDGSVTLVSETNPLFVRDASPYLPAGAATQTTLADASSYLDTLTGWNESDRAAVNPISGEVGIQGGTGDVTSNTLRVVLATNQGLPAGANALGSVIVTSLEPGSAADSLGKARNVTAGADDVGVALLAVRDDELSPLAEAEGKYAPLRMDADGALHTLQSGAMSSAYDSVQTMPVPGIANALHTNKRYTSAATGDAIWTPTSGSSLVVTNCRITTYGTTAGTIIVWISTSGSADTTFSTGTDKAIFDGEFVPSATSKPGVIMANLLIPGTVDYPVRVTSVGDIDFTVHLEGYEVAS